MTKRAPVSTGSTTIDALLDGGLDRGAVTQVYGPPAAGKSTLAMSSAVTTARSGGTAVYLDTEGLSLDRLEQITVEVADPDRVEEVLDRIMVTTVADYDEQSARLRETTSMAEGTDLIVIDSVTALYRVARTDEGDDGEALDRLGNQLALLLGLARRYDLAVLVTNQVFTDPDAERIRPLGGETLAHWSETILRLDRFRGPRRRLVLEKHRGTEREEAVMLELVDGGLAGLDVSPP